MGSLHQYKDEVKSSNDRYDNDIEHGNWPKNEYNNDMEDATWIKNGSDINRWDGNWIKDIYNNDLASKYNKYRIIYNINKNKYHII